jgi:uncharacterized protein (DUF1330 family)
MPAYVILDIDVTDPDEYEGYRQRSGAIADQYGGRFLVRGGGPRTVEGDWAPSRIVVLEFPSSEAARAWYDSPEYQEILPLRQGAAESRAILVDGA